MAKKKLGLAEEYEIYQTNAVAFPGLLEWLRVTLGDSLSIDAIMDLGIGYHPNRHSWVFPERNARGDIVGFQYRHVDTGQKLCAKGAKRGLTYIFNSHFAKNAGVFKPGAHNWARTTDTVPCPICGKKKFCMLDRSNPQDPGVVLCTKVGAGSKRRTTNGWIHELKPGGDKCGSHVTVLRDSDLPYLLVEGGTDVIAGHTLDFTTIGRPSNTGGVKELRRMPIKGHPLVAIGENDQQVTALGKEIWPGYDGVLKLCVEMRDIAPIKMIMPPEGIKDFRAWVESGLTQEQLLEYIEQNAQCMSEMPASVFETDDPLFIADKFLAERHTTNDILTLRDYKGVWLGWNGVRYKEVTREVLRGQVYSFLEGKSAVVTSTAGDPMVKPLKASARRVSDIIDAFSKCCPVTVDMPCWVDIPDGMPAVEDIIAFRNGLLDVASYCEGDIVLYKPDPRYFSTFALPYDFDETLESPLAEKFFADVFDGDEERMELMQQWFGYNLVPDTSMQKFMLMVGVPRSGKSTIVEMIQHMVGLDHCCSIRFDDLASEFGRQPMLGKQCAFIGDTRSPTKGVAGAAMEQLLRIVGEDATGVNRKRIDALANVLLKVRFTFAMNELPFFIDNSNAMAARMLVLNFDKSYVGREDYSLRGRLREEAKRGALMNYALRGLKDLRTQKRFTEPAAANETMEEFVEMASPVATFIKECCEYEKDCRIKKDKVFEVWSGWAEDAGYRPGVKVHFGRKFISASLGRVLKGRMRQTREHAFIGIKLTQESQDRYLGGE